MPYLFYGEDTYSIKEKINGIKQKFLQKDSADINFSFLNGTDTGGDIFWNTVLAAPFLTDKRLVIVQNLLLKNKDEEFKKSLAKQLERIPGSTLVFFIELGQPDKRSALFKALNQKKYSQVFGLPTPHQIGQFIEERILRESISISPQNKSKLLLYVGNDYHRALNETEKLILYVKSKNVSEIKEGDIDLLVCPENNASIFNFIDYLAAKKTKEAALSLQKLILSGENELYILTMIVYQFRNLLKIDDLKQKKYSRDQIAREAKIHPFVVAKSLSSLNYFDDRKLLDAIYLRLSKLDFEIKSGKIEGRLGLDLLITSLY
jgi:DNA polymerase-3 subunit delta